jgi:hypothetical protein
VRPADTEGDCQTLATFHPIPARRGHCLRRHRKGRGRRPPLRLRTPTRRRTRSITTSSPLSKPPCTTPRRTAALSGPALGPAAAWPTRLSRLPRSTARSRSPSASSLARTRPHKCLMGSVLSSSVWQRLTPFHHASLGLRLQDHLPWRRLWPWPSAVQTALALGPSGASRSLAGFYRPLPDGLAGLTFQADPLDAEQFVMQLDCLRKSGFFDSRREAETRRFMTEVVGMTAAVNTVRARSHAPAP